MRKQMTNTAKIALYLFHLILFLLVSQSLGKPHIVKSLPGYPGDLPFTLETGYTGVGESEEVKLFYYFIESERDVERDPLMIWLTGGPGCSAVSGLILEIGPLHCNLTSQLDATKLLLNPHSWTKVASIIFVDSPVGTGFSYATTNRANYSSDTLQSAHIYDFLRKWLIKHPKFTNNPLYVSGDSYSGIIIPIVVQDILQGNEIGLKPKLNLKGYVIGNPVTLLDADSNAVFEYAHRISLLSDELYKSALISCNGDFVNVDAKNIKCLSNLHSMNQAIKSIDQAHVLEHNCQSQSPKPLKKVSPHEYNEGHPLLVKGDPCQKQDELLLHSWANDEQVREALHIQEGTIDNWERCNRNLAYENNVQFSFDYHMNVSRKSLQVLIFSGDQDMLVPYVGTHQWIKQLNVPITEDWRPWFVDGQVAGYVTEFSLLPYQLVYTTIKGGAHTAAENKPRECFAMIERWLSLSPL